MEIIRNYGKLKGKPYAEQSLKIFSTQLKKLNNGEIPKDTEIFKDTQAIEKMIETTLKGKDNIKNLSITTQRNYYNTIIIFLKSYGLKEDDSRIIKFFVDKSDRLTENILKERENKTIDDYPNWESLDNLNESTWKPLFSKFYNKPKDMRVRELQLLQRYIIITCYLKNPSLRGDWATVKITNGKDLPIEDGNYYNIKTEQLYLREYKTSKHYNELRLKPSDETRKMIKYYWNNYKEFYRNDDTDTYYLLNSYHKPLKKWIPMGRKNLAKLVPVIFEKHTGKKITINLLRKIHATENTDMEALKRTKQVAHFMGHSLHTHLTTYHASVIS